MATELTFVDGTANGFRIVAEIDDTGEVPLVRDGENFGFFPVGFLTAVRVEMFAPANPLYLVDGIYGFSLDWERFGVTIPRTFYNRVGGVGTGETFIMPPDTPFNLGTVGVLRTETTWERLVHGPQSITLEQEVTIRIDGTAGTAEDWSFSTTPTTNNLLVCIPGIDKNKAVNTGCNDGGVAWTRVREHGVGTTSDGTSGAILVKDSEGDENSTQTTTWDTSSADICQWAGEYSGTLAAASVVDLNFVVGDATLTDTVDIDSDPTTTAQADELALFIAFRDSENGQTPTYSDSFTEVWNSNGTGVLAGTYIGSKVLTATGVVRCLIDTGTDTDEVCGIGITLKQASTDVTIAVPKGDLTLTGQAPVSQEGKIVQTGNGSLSLTGFAPIQFEGRSLTPDAGSLSLTGFIPIVLTVEDVIALPGKGDLSLTGFAPVLSFGIPVPKGDLALTGQAPTLQESEIVKPGLGSLILIGRTPTIANPGSLPHGRRTFNVNVRRVSSNIGTG